MYERTLWAALVGRWAPEGAPGMSRQGSGGRLGGGVTCCIMSMSPRCSGQPRLGTRPLGSRTCRLAGGKGLRTACLACNRQAGPGQDMSLKGVILPMVVWCQVQERRVSLQVSLIIKGYEGVHLPASEVGGVADGAALRGHHGLQLPPRQGCRRHEHLHMQVW